MPADDDEPFHADLLIDDNLWGWACEEEGTFGQQGPGGGRGENKRYDSHHCSVLPLLFPLLFSDPKGGPQINIHPVMAPKDVHILITRTCDNINITWQKGFCRDDSLQNFEMRRSVCITPVDPI